MKSSIRSRRQRNPRHRDLQREKPFFSKTKQNKQPFFEAHPSTFSTQGVQPKLTIGQPGDKYEREADAVANSIVTHDKSRPSVENQAGNSIQRITLATPQEDEKLGTAESRMEKDKLIQEKRQEPEEEPVQMQQEEEEPIQMQQEEEEPVQMQQEEEEPVQMKAESGRSKSNPGLSKQLKKSSGKGAPITEKTRMAMEQVFGKDFSKVRIHTDDQAAKMCKELGAQAFTRGNDIYFNTGKYNPGTTQGKKLLAHELTHVVQQSK